MDLGGLHKVYLISAYYHRLGLATKRGIVSSSCWIRDLLLTEIDPSISCMQIRPSLRGFCI